MYFDDGRFYVTTLHFGSFHMLSKKVHIVNHKKMIYRSRSKNGFVVVKGPT